jgi:hypothetical protein
MLSKSFIVIVGSRFMAFEVISVGKTRRVTILSVVGVVAT